MTLKDQYDQAYGYWTENGVSTDNPKALELFIEVSDKGCLDAKRFLAYLYLNGVGVETDIAKGLNYFYEVCNSENEKDKELIAESCLRMGSDCYTGFKNKVNFRKCIKYLLRAKELGHPDAESRLELYRTINWRMRFLLWFMSKVK